MADLRLNRRVAGQARKRSFVPLTPVPCTNSGLWTQGAGFASAGGVSLGATGVGRSTGFTHDAGTESRHIQAERH
jgi:hypothetical protein